MSIIITCAGSQARWDGPGLKQLWEVLGEPILHRTLRQVADDGRKVCIATSAEMFDQLTKGAPYIDARLPELLDVGETRYWCETLLKTESAWTENNVAILGDVFFTDEAMETLLGARGLHCQGRAGQSPYTAGPGETFAMTWSSADAPRFKDALNAAIAHAVAHPLAATGYDDKLCPLATPWQPYRILAGFHPETHQTDGKIWIETNDWTDDVDDVQRAKRLTRRLAAQFAHDNDQDPAAHSLQRW